ncbi:Cyclopentanone monooxygenase [Pseudonocardia dioxanivorans CB1190]|uniref:Cyclopentanone monooxygenase n=1 Tax=Pseudonocardia dioxanivorans (strain ATCC 55486 / DSM 44775 / JCM 13855 / CB1190) TaxID=675635 RepID=F4D237_PSEUX|nr:NAD(P)/FAD-dependent oxidoreductase [Pseudonocardia dioxanivorans]AEA28097.1 Cyclopentanone monooxygenase [Pseudonocardia dioxanivorans CB1190]
MTTTQPAGPTDHDTAAGVLDVLIIGGGFSGLYQLDRLRDLGFDVKVWDSAGGLGGVWWWNCYPGARTDTVGHIYQFAHKDLWKDFDFRERFPDHAEVREYFEHVDRKLELSKDIEFDTFAAQARWDEDRREWTVVSADGKQQRARVVLVATGFGSKPLYPDIPGTDTFEGECHHTARWPQGGIDMTGKRVVIIGTGASGVQVFQEAAKVAAEVTLFQRTPNLALPMGQRSLDHAANDEVRKGLPERFATRYTAFAGFDFTFMDEQGATAGPEQLRATYERFWAEGGFPIWLGMYSDLLADEAVNRTFYDFWREKVHERVHDPVTAELLAPETPPHPFGVKRPALEQDYFDLFNRDGVRLVDQNDEPVLEITPKGVVTRNGLIECDVIALATGFDNNRGGIMAIDIQGVGGERLQDKWADRVDTFMGLSTAGFPNMIFLYGPQSPSGFCNGPTSAEYQGDIVVEFLEHLREHGHTRFESTGDAEKEWTAHVDELFEGSLFTRARSWYWGANVPGKPAQMLNYSGGLVSYFGKWDEVRAGGYPQYELD